MHNCGGRLIKRHDISSYHPTFAKRSTVILGKVAESAESQGLLPVPELTPRVEHHIEPHRYLQEYVEHVKRVDIFQPCSLTVKSPIALSRTGHTPREAMCGPTLIAIAQCRELPDRGESCSGGRAKQHSTAVSTLVRRSGLKVIGWDFDMDMTLGPARGKLSRG